MQSSGLWKQRSMGKQIREERTFIEKANPTGSMVMEKPNPREKAQSMRKQTRPETWSWRKRTRK